MSIRFDWTFWVVLATSALVPFWLWRADLASRSLHFRQISQTSLQPPDTAKALELKVSLAGAELQTPYLTVFELVNDGSRPIPATDFESPIEIGVTNKALILRATLTAAKPSDLSPSVVAEEGRMKLKPMLLNPGDSLTFAILTTGGEPVFQTRTRIAGVQSVPIVDIRDKAPSPIKIAGLFVAALVYLVAASIVVDGWPSAGVRLRPRSAFLVFVATAGPAGFSLMTGLEGIGIDGFWALTAAFVLSLVIASIIALWVNRTEPKPKEAQGAA